MAVAYSNGVAIFGTNDLDALASSTTLVAGWESALITNTGDNHLLSGKIKANNTAPTAGRLEVWAIPVYDVSGAATYIDVFDGTSSAETVTYRNVLLQAGALVKGFDTDVTANRFYEFSNVSLAGLFDEMPQKYSLFVVHSMVQALNATAAAGGQCWYQQITY